MPYLLLIIEPVGQRRERTEDEGRALYDRMLRFAGDLQSRGLQGPVHTKNGSAKDGWRDAVRGAASAVG